MKTTITTAISFAFLLGITSCSNTPNTDNTMKEPTTTATPSGGDLMSEAPAYDKSKIDLNAPVIEITLKATGNTMTEMKYDQKEIKVKAGTTIKLTLINTGNDAAMVHNFVLIEEGSDDKVGPAGLTAGADKNYTPDLKEVLVATDMAGPGKKTTITFPAPEKGTYDFICTYPGHYKMMNGKFIVE